MEFGIFLKFSPQQLKLQVLLEALSVTCSDVAPVFLGKRLCTFLYLTYRDSGVLYTLSSNANGL